MNMATNTLAQDSSKMKQIEVLADDAGHRAYHAELDAIDRETKRLENGPSSEAEWDQWEEWSSRVWSEIEVLPPTPENAPLKVRAVWSIVSGNVENINVGQSTCCRMVRQIVSGLAEAGWNTATLHEQTWAEAMTVFEAARAAEITFDGKILTPAFNRAENGGPSIPEEVSDESARLTDLRCDAEDALIAKSAPDLSRVIWKIEYARERWQHCEGWPDNWWAAIMLDLNRIAAGEAA